MDFILDIAAFLLQAIILLGVFLVAFAGVMAISQRRRGAGEEGGKGEDAEGVGAEGDAENADRRGSRARERHLTGFDVLRSLWCGEADIASRVRRAVGFAAERGGES